MSLTMQEKEQLMQVLNRTGGQREVNLRQRVIPEEYASLIHQVEREELTLADFQKYGMEYGSKTADPQFEDPAARDFRLKETSPAFDLGIKPIDASDVGPRK